MEKVYIVAAQRTPIGKFNGQLASKSAVELGAIAIKAAVEKAKLSGNDIDQVLMGNVIQAGTGQNPARQASMAAGLGEQVPRPYLCRFQSSGRTGRYGMYQLCRWLSK